MARERRAAAAAILALSAALLAPGAGPATAGATAVAAQQPAEVVVKVAPGCTITGLASSASLRLVGGIVPSRGIYRVGSTDPAYVGPLMTLVLLARLKLDRCVTYAEADSLITVGDAHFHSWPTGDPVEVSEGDWSDQAAVHTLRLPEAHERSTGAGAVVAVLDTGVDPAHPVLAGHLVGGWDYVDDDADPTDRRAGVDTDQDGRVDEGYGHGTFVSGLALLVAPDARIMPLRVLDSDGVGNVFGVAQAIDDAVSAGATVINLSFGSRVDSRSQVLRDAIAYAAASGVAVVAAAGNDGSDQPHYPAAQSQVVAVGALEPDGAGLTDFSARGDWVDVAAPGRDLVGPLPGGVYAAWSGTSMATPLVSGQVALLDSALGGRTTTAVDAVLRSADRVLGLRVRRGVIDPVGSLDAVT